MFIGATVAVIETGGQQIMTVVHVEVTRIVEAVIKMTAAPGLGVEEVMMIATIAGEETPTGRMPVTGRDRTAGRAVRGRIVVDMTAEIAGRGSGITGRLIGIEAMISHPGTARIVVVILVTTRIGSMTGENPWIGTGCSLTGKG